MFPTHVGVNSSSRMDAILDAYLDIETTGLSPYRHRISVVGIAYDDEGEVVQLIGDEITSSRLTEVISGVSVICTYNGTRFDLPFIQAQFGINLARLASHHDLMLDCWKRNLYGGQKAIERRLGIARNLSHMDGRDAARLWQKYRKGCDEEALARLLTYNREDVLNLRLLRYALRASPMPGC